LISNRLSILFVSILSLAILLTGCAPTVEADRGDLPTLQTSTEGGVEAIQSNQKMR
jgi:hypothetical protein